VAPAQLWLLGIVGTLKALGLVLVAQSLGMGIVAVIAHRSVAEAVLLGVTGAATRGVASWASRVVGERTAIGVKQRLRSELATALLHRRRPPVGSAATLASGGLDELDAYYTTFLPALMNAATVPLLLGARIVFADWLSAVVIVLTLPLVPAFMALIGMHTRDRVAAATDALGRLSDHFVELARGLPVLVGLGRVDEQTRAMTDISDDYRTASMRTLRTAFLSALALELISTISVAVVAVFIGVRLLGGGMSLEAGLFALILAPECFAPFRDVGTAFHASDAGREALRRVRAVLDPPEGTGVFIRRSAAGVRTNRLSVRYADRSEPAVHALTLRASAGEITLLDGRSGAGKSTVLAVLAGRGACLDPDATCTGTVTVADQDRIAWLPQHPHAVASSARDELLLYGAVSTDAADDLLTRVALDPQADPGSFSSGELRRLAFARVLARVDAGATVILLDEPTAHLDAAAAARVRSEIAALRRRVTVVVASHDPAVQALADQRVSIGRHHAGGAPADAVAPAPGDSASGTDTTETIAAPARTDVSAVRTMPGMPARRFTAARELAAFLRPAAARFIAATLVGALAAGFAIALTVVSGWLIVRASQEPAIMYLLVAIVGVRFFGIGRSALRYAERLLTHDAVFRALTALRLRLWRGLGHRGPAGRAALAPARALSTLVGDADRIRDLAARVVAPPAVAVLTLAGATVALGLIFPPSAVVVALFALVAVVIAPTWALVGAHRAGRVNETARSALMRSFAGALDAADELTANGADAVVRGRLAALDEQAAVTARQGALTDGVAGAIVVGAGVLAAVAMLPLTAAAVASGSLAAAAVAVLTLTPLALIEPVLELTTAVRHWPALASVLRRVAPVTADARAGTADAPGSASATIADASLGLDDLGFRYPSAPADVFRGVTAHVSDGGWLTVTGPSGSGKSTMLALLMRHLRPTRGRCLIGGTDLAGLPQSAVLDRVAWCPQEGHLFTSTLRANLAIARPRGDAPTAADMRDALARVGLGQLVATLPHGLDTMIGSEGGRLSGGQRQRVAVARTLLADGDVVMIDEPTAHLDEQAATALMRDLRTGLRGRTVVLVTHHPDEVRPTDALLRLGDEGSDRGRSSAAVARRPSAGPIAAARSQSASGSAQGLPRRP